MGVVSQESLQNARTASSGTADKHRNHYGSFSIFRGVQAVRQGTRSDRPGYWSLAIAPQASFTMAMSSAPEAM